MPDSTHLPAADDPDKPPGAAARRTVVTGIKATGTPHLGNLAGAIRPALDLAAAGADDCLYFIADYHALTGEADAAGIRAATRAVAAAWLACGLEPERSALFRQSAVPEVMELNWILACACPKGFMNRAHAYKAAVAANAAGKGKGQGRDPDAGVSMGLFSYPVLMAADILAYGADAVPVGRDQLQHLEYARDLAERFNRRHGPVFRVPQALVRADMEVLPGLDGEKMSKSRGNTIPLFAEPDAIRDLVARIRTDARVPGEPKDPETSAVFRLYAAFASPRQAETMRLRFHGGISWADAKEELAALLVRVLEEPRRRHRELSGDAALLDRVLEAGAARARERAAPVLEAARSAVGLDRRLAG